MLAVLNQLHAWDAEAFLAINRLFQALHDVKYVGELLKMLNGLGNPYIVLLVGGSVACLAPRLRDAWGRFAELVLASVLIIAATRLKEVIGRPRPQSTLADAFETGEAVALFGERGMINALPSGHTTQVFALAALLFVWAGRSERLRGRRVFIGIHLFALALAVGLCRIGAGMHYPGDVLAGAALGLACGWAATRPLGLLGRARAASPTSTPDALGVERRRPSAAR